MGAQDGGAQDRGAEDGGTEDGGTEDGGAPQRPRHFAAFRPGQVPAEADGRLHSPSFARNADPILKVLASQCAGLRGRALELASGTGQHVCHFAAALPGLAFTPSDPDPVHRASIDAWRARLGVPVAPARDLDAAGDWPAAVADIAPLALVLAINLLHIAPWRVTEGLVRGAARALAPGGILFIYGPFRQGGRHTGPGNAAFDAGLRAENPEWGLRDIEAVAAAAQAAGLTGPDVVIMPADNRSLVFRRPASG